MSELIKMEENVRAHKNGGQCQCADKKRFLKILHAGIQCKPGPT